MRFKVLILAARCHFSFSRFGDKIAVSHLATVPDNLELIGCGIIRHHFADALQFYNKADPDDQASRARLGEPPGLTLGDVSTEQVDRGSRSWMIHTLE